MAAEGNSNLSSLPLLPAGWCVAAVEDLCENVTTGGTPLRSNPNFFIGGRHNWYKTGELKDSVLFEAEERITDEALERCSAKLFPKDTVLMAMYGDGHTITSLGILASEAATNQACCAMLANRAVCEPRFLFYALRFHRDDFIRLASGGAQRNLSGKLIRRFALNVPPLTEQRAIAHILGTLDDKIELNRRTNETLEAIARALFKSWFVDFDPVRAKAEGRDPGQPKQIADLFPDRFDDSQLGEIPEGWCVGNMSDLATLSRDSIDPGQFPDETFDHFSIPAFDEGRLPKSERGDTIKSNKFVVLPTCLLVSKLNPRIPRIWFPALQGSRRAVCSTEFLVLLPAPGISREYLFCLVSDVEFVSVFATLVTGTSGSHQRVKREGLLGMDVVISPPALIDRFTEIVQPLVKLVCQSIEQSRTLAALRDTLLPNLISGELRVRGLKKTILGNGQRDADCDASMQP
jgi:type I restriction enzyme S subunit